ncbi:hypothetical protein [Solibacillus sp. FSL K6-1554]|uniref:hypothetical protein n=1 Tax=Solibacillus sp. FSL K6-1554 TaxID=2921472 RepID=UPI0030F802A9
MDKNQQELKRLLEKQFEGCKWQDGILEEIENKLYEMKELAEYARDHVLTTTELNKLNERLNLMKQEVHSLGQQLQPKIN